MSDFDIDHFEWRVQRLLEAYHRLQEKNRALETEITTLSQRNEELCGRVTAVIDRMKALEQQEQEP